MGAPVSHLTSKVEDLLADEVATEVKMLEVQHCSILDILDNQNIIPAAHDIIHRLTWTWTPVSAEYAGRPEYKNSKRMSQSRIHGFKEVSQSKLPNRGSEVMPSVFISEMLFDVDGLSPAYPLFLSMRASEGWAPAYNHIQGGLFWVNISC